MRVIIWSGNSSIGYIYAGGDENHDPQEPTASPWSLQDYVRQLRNRDNPRPWTDGRMKKMQDRETWSAIRFIHKKEGNPICRNMDGPWGHRAKWNKPDTKTNTPRSHFHVESKKRRNRARLETENKLVAGGGGWARGSKPTRLRWEDEGPWGPASTVLPGARL